MTKILIMAGGTGGHVFPGLAVAKRLQREGMEINWLGTLKGIEAKLVPEAGLPIHFISISGVRGKGGKDILLAPLRLIKAIWQALRIIHRFKPDVVIGLGGFASGPGGIASFLLRRPLIIHEQNAKPGMTNKWLARVAKKVLSGFPDTFSSKNVLVIGNPVREEIINLPPPAERFQGRSGALRLLVLGGSLGAAAINQLLPQALAKLAETQRIEVRHQTGEKHFADTVALYQQAGVSADVVPFIKEMAQAYAWADLVLCRAGALTIAELCAAGLGAILVPYPHAVDDHQTANANFMVRSHAALLIQQRDLSIEKLTDTLRQFIERREKCLDMAQAAYQLRKIHAADEVLQIVSAAK